MTKEIFLCKGDVKAYKALGTDNGPVYDMHGQLRVLIDEVVNAFPADQALEQGGSKPSSFSQHFAIPHFSNDHAQVDWYAEHQHDSSEVQVLPWAQLSNTQKADLQQQLKEINLRFTQISSQVEQLWGASSTASEQRLIDTALGYMARYPNLDTVYWVNGVAVITYWGFSKDEFEQEEPELPEADDIEEDPDENVEEDERQEKPESTTPQAALAAAPIASAASSYTPPPNRRRRRFCVYTRRSWWSLSRLWRWLLTFGLLALLLFLLRGCMPNGALPSFGSALPSMGSLTSGSGSVGGLASGVGNMVSGVGDALGGAYGKVSSLFQSPSLPAVSTPSISNAGGGAPATYPHLSTGSSNSQTVLNSNEQLLQLPEEITDLSFLDGVWENRGGIQDSRTGRPVSVRYDFSDGKGDVEVTRTSAGEIVKCDGKVQASVDGQQLHFVSSDLAICDNGSDYVLDPVVCSRSTDGSNTAWCGTSSEQLNYPLKRK